MGGNTPVTEKVKPKAGSTLHNEGANISYEEERQDTVDIDDAIAPLFLAGLLIVITRMPGN